MINADESELKKASLTKLIEAASQKLNFLPVLDDKTSTTLKPILGVPSKTLTLRCQQPCQNISFESLPPLGVRDSLENIIRRYTECPRRNLLRSIVKANSLQRRPRRQLHQNKTETVAGSNDLNTLKSKTCQEGNLKNLGCQLAKERKVFNRFSIGRFDRNMRHQIKGEDPKAQFGNALYQGLSYEEVSSPCKNDAINLQISSNNSKTLRSSCCLDVQLSIHESQLRTGKRYKLLFTPNESYSSIKMLCSLEKLNLNPAECEGTVGVERLQTSQETPENEALVDLMFKKNDLSTWFKDGLINERVDKTNALKQYKKYGLDFQELNEIEYKTVDSPRMAATTNNSFIDLQSCTSSRVDFSSGDDTRNLTLKFILDEKKSVSKVTCVKQRQNPDYESKRSVQWNSEVDVIYYAGDTDGGKVVRRKIELLREEADQQASRTGFIRLALNKNLISAFNSCKFRDPWVTVYHK